jgi:hypothetical protein
LGSGENFRRWYLVTTGKWRGVSTWGLCLALASSCILFLCFLSAMTWGASSSHVVTSTMFCLTTGPETNRAKQSWTEPSETMSQNKSFLL